MRPDVMMLLRRPAPSFEDHREWRNVAVIGDQWEVEMDAYGDMSKESTYRHRLAYPGGIRGDWHPGRPPSGHWRTPVWQHSFYPNHEKWGDREDGDIVIYGRKGTGSGCSDPSFSVWMVPGSGYESDPTD